MSLVHWSPFGEVSLFSARQGRPAGSKTEAISWNPAVGFYESGNEVVVHVELPEVDHTRVAASVENNILTIRGEGHVEGGEFARSFTLSTAVDPAKVCSTCEGGVLTITLPKAESAESNPTTYMGNHSAEEVTVQLSA